MSYKALVQYCLHPGDSCWRLARTLLKRYEWVHLIIGIMGNILFLAGSLAMLYGSRMTAVYLFIAGSSGMLIGSLGQLVVSLERRKHKTQT
jgi:hypothetical protein